MRDSCLRRLVLAHLCSAVGEWAITVGLLVYTFAWGGAVAVGPTSIVILLIPLTCTPVVVGVMARWRPHAVRVGGLAVQALAYGAAAFAAAWSAPAPVVAMAVVVGLVATVMIPPSGAALMPLIARSTDDLIGAHLWVGHCDSASALVGSLAAGVVVGIAGPAVLFGLCAVGALVGLGATIWRASPTARAARPRAADGRHHALGRALAELRARPWSRGVLAISSARNIVVGAFDVLLVVLALDVLGLGNGGPGYLSALVGFGALVSTVFVTIAVRRSRLRGALMTAIILAAVVAIVIGARAALGVVVVALPVMGVAIASMDALSRILLQRSSDPRGLGPLFAVLAFVAGAGQLAGSVLAQIAIAAGGPRVALVAVGVVLAVLAAVSVRSLRRADAHVELPVTEMTLLAGLPMFERLPTSALEQVARLAAHEPVAPGDTLLVEGAPCDVCLVVVDGAFQVSARGRTLGTAGRGDALGELALLTNLGSTSTVTALTAGEVLRIDREPFLVALSGHEVGSTFDVLEPVVTLERYRDLIESYARHATSTRAESWLGLGAVGRLLGDPAFTDVLRRGIGLAGAADDDLLVAHAAAMTTWPGAFFHVADRPDHDLIELCEAALARLAPDDPLRVRVLSALASHATFAYTYARRAEVIGEAGQLAEQIGDPLLVAAVLNSEFISHWEPATLDRREVIAGELLALAATTGDAETEFLGGFFAAYCTAERGDLSAAREQLAALGPVVRRARIAYFEFLADRLTLSIDIARGVSGVRERIDALARRHAHSHADTAGTWALQLGALAYQEETVGALGPMIDSMIEGPHARTWRAARALAELRAGDAEAATATLDEQGDVPRNYFWVTVLQTQAEVAAALGLTERCAELYAALEPYAGRVGITASGSLCFGLVSRSLGELAIALDRLDDADAHLADARLHAARIGWPFEAEIVERRLALLRGRRAAAP